MTHVKISLSEMTELEYTPHSKRKKKKLKLVGWNKFDEATLMEINVKSVTGDQNRKTKSQVRRYRMG